MDRQRSGRRLAAVLRLADVVAAASAAGSFQPQSLPAPLVARMVGRVGRLHGLGATRMAKVVPQGGLAKFDPNQPRESDGRFASKPATFARSRRLPALGKGWGAALTVGSMALPLLTETQTGQRAMRWTGKKIGSAWRAMGGTKRTAAKVRRGARALGAGLDSQRATLSSAAAAGGTFLLARDYYRDRDA